MVLTVRCNKLKFCRIHVLASTVHDGSSLGSTALISKLVVRPAEADLMLLMLWLFVIQATINGVPPTSHRQVAHLSRSKLNLSQRRLLTVTAKSVLLR